MALCRSLQEYLNRLATDKKYGVYLSSAKAEGYTDNLALQ